LAGQSVIVQGEQNADDGSVSVAEPELRRQLQLSEEAVIHSIRYAMLTHLGESGTDIFAISMKVPLSK